MTLPTTQPINGTEDDSDMFGPPRSSPPIGYHHHRSKVPMISPKLRQREERKRILQLCAHKLERIKDSEANLRRSVCINNTYSRLTDELRREKQSRYLANLPKSEIKPEAAHNNTFSSYKCSGSSSTNNSNCNNNSNLIHNNNQINSGNVTCNGNSNLQHQNDPMEMYPSSTIQNYHNLHYQQQHCHQSSMSSPSSTTCITTSVHSTAKPTIPYISNNNNNNNNSNNNNLSHSSNNHNNSISASCSFSSSSSSCQFYSNNSSIQTTAAQQSRDFASISSYSQTSTISTATTTFTCHGSATANMNKDNTATSSSSSPALPTQSQSSTASSSMITPTTMCSRNSVDADLEILDRELSAIDATMPLTDPEITQGAEHLEKAVSSRKRLRSEDDSDRYVRNDPLASFYLSANSAAATSTAQKLLSSVIDDCSMDLKRPKLSLCSLPLAAASSSLSSTSLSSLSSICGIGLSGLGNGINSIGSSHFNYGIGIGLGFGVGFGTGLVSNSYALGCCSQVASSLMSVAAAGVSSSGTMLSNSCGSAIGGINNINNNGSLITNDLDLELALDYNPPNQKEFEVIMDALRLGTPSPTSSCGSDSCGQAAMMSETGCNSGGIFNNLVVTSLET